MPPQCMTGSTGLISIMSSRGIGSRLSTSTFWKETRKKASTYQTPLPNRKPQKNNLENQQPHLSDQESVGTFLGLYGPSRRLPRQVAATSSAQRKRTTFPEWLSAHWSIWGNRIALVLYTLKRRFARSYSIYAINLEWWLSIFPTNRPYGLPQRPSSQ